MIFVRPLSTVVVPTSAAATCGHSGTFGELIDILFPPFPRHLNKDFRYITWIFVLKIKGSRSAPAYSLVCFFSGNIISISSGAKIKVLIRFQNRMQTAAVTNRAAIVC